jgi:type IV pilus assembly protein PilY1
MATMTQAAHIPQYRRWLAGVLAVILGLGPLASPSYAALTLLADSPLSAQNQSKPNVVLTVDDSTSMLFDFLPDDVIQNNCRGMTGIKNANCGFAGQNTVGRYVTVGHTFQQYGMPFSATNPAFDISGPGAGCIGAACSTGIDPAPTPPGALVTWTLYPGIERYPLGTSPKAGQPYEYWTLWPAPAHNSEFNKISYNPRQQYDPPIDAYGNPYPVLNSGATTGWTRVPADPWAEPWTAPWAPWPAPVRFIDLTAPVTVGLWCNSDWSIGNESNPAYCRTNGTGALAASSPRSSDDGDYSYPWAPPGIVLTDPPSIAKSIAYSKVDTAGVLKAAWISAEGRDPKYFYQNDNILWCDATSPQWPHQGPLIPQTCIDGSATPQTCVNRVHQTCNPGTPQTCVGANPGTCGGIRPQTCGPTTAQTCTPGLPQTCVILPSQTCDGIGPQTCNGVAPQTCDNVTPQTCVDLAAQTCNGIRTQTCNLTAATCVPPDPRLCTDGWEYQNEDLTWTLDTIGYCSGPTACTGSECRACRPTTTCPSARCSSNGADCVTAATCPDTGLCSIDTATSCTLANAATQCPPKAGTCSRETTRSCNADPECPDSGNCSTNIFATCTAANAALNCPTIPGRCSTDGNACLDSSTCPNEGYCSITNAICPPDVCATQPGQCTITRAACFDNTACVRGGTCSTTGAACSTNPECPPVGRACDISGVDCSATGVCPGAGHCDLQPAVICYNPGPDPLECPTLPGTCTNAPTSCFDNTGCPPVGGTCSGSPAACSVDTDCPILNQNCSDTGEPCTATPYFPICQQDFVTTCSEPSYCRIHGGYCSTGSDNNGPCSPIVFNTPPFWTFFPSYDVGYCNAILVEGHCSVDIDTHCFGPGTCPATHGPSGSAVCSDTLKDFPAISLLQDANGPGVVCRHNNRSAGAYTSGPTDYPNATFNTPVTAGTGANACVASPRYAAVPRHYWKTGVEFCEAQVSTPPDKWLGYGSRTLSNCQSAQDATHIYPRFYQFGADPGCTNPDLTVCPVFRAPSPAFLDNYTTPAFRRTDLTAASAPFVHSWVDDDGAQTISRSYAEEMTNYANWFAYYRTRIQAVKTVTSASFSEIDAKYRVGFHTMNLPPTFLNVADFDSTVQKPAWFAKLFGVTIPLGQETPTLDGVVRIGEYFLNPGASTLSGATDPIQLSCQQNFHMLFTDGITNQSPPTTTIGNMDGVTVPTTVNMYTMPSPDIAHPEWAIVPGSAWPRPYREGLAAANALSDLALYYWVTDLRPGACPVCTDNVPTDNNPPLARDRYSAKWQHLHFAALSLGTTGKLPAANQRATETAIGLGTLEWPQPNPVNRPDAAGVDDLWHAAVNGHGDFVNASAIEDVKLGIGRILAGVSNLPGTRTSVGFISNTFGASANFIYRPRFEQAWSGSLAKIEINPVTGAALLLPPAWDTATRLKAVTDVPGGWLTGRRIVTMNEAGVPIPFLWGSLGAAQRDSLAPGKPDARIQSIVAFLRGDRTKEGERVGKLRLRAPSPQGDIVDSSPVYVGRPNAPYLEANDPGYTAFKTAFSGRLPHVYVGGNDGMMHAIDDANGNERWAYVPTPLFRGGLARPLPPVPNDPKTGLGALAYQDGALPGFRHHFYVDLTPKIVDVDANARPSAPAWRTLLVGGLGKGGNRYFALDVTDPASVTNEATAASKVLWEFPPPGDVNPIREMGYTYGKPIIAKTREFGRAWLVMVGSGYNSPTGEGKIYFLNANDGSVENMMHTSAGDAGNPAGLAHPGGYTQDFHNQLAEQLYAGDLLGNFWRFDVSGTLPWPAPGRLAKLSAPAVGTPQPVTTPPEIKIDVNNGIDRWVFVGTGKLYDETDLAITQVQTMYAFRDGTASGPWALPATPIEQGVTLGTEFVALDPLNPANKFGLASVPAKGWYHNLPAGQRIVVPPQAAAGVLAYVVTKTPSADLCAIGLPVTVYARDYGTGQSLLTDATDPAVPVFGIDIEEGGVGLQIVTFQSPDGGASSTPDVRLAITLPDGTVRYIKPQLPTKFFQHRMSWRLLGQ